MCIRTPRDDKHVEKNSWTQSDWRRVWAPQQQYYKSYLWFPCSVRVKVMMDSAGFKTLSNIIINVSYQGKNKHCRLNVIFSNSDKSPSLFPLDLCWSGALLLTWSVCCAAWLRVLKHIRKLWVHLLLAASRVWREPCAGLEKGLPFWPQISRESKLVSSKRGLPPPPPWFTAPTEMKLGTATVSAPGPLSSGQDELFAEDIQMYKEQIRLTQSSFAWRERKKKENRVTSKRPLSPCFLNEWKGLGVKTALCIQSANSQLIPLIHSWSTFNCVSSHSKDMFVAFNWRSLWNHWNVWLVGPT